MLKNEFMAELQKKLVGLPEKELEERLAFYSEMIDDRVEEGTAEADAVTDLGSVEEVAAQILADIPLAKLAKERIKPKRRLRAWEIVLIAVGSPIWLSLAVAALAVLLSLYVAVWSVVVSLWAILVSLGVCGLVGLIVGGAFVLEGNTLSGVAWIGASLVCSGLAIVLFFGCKAASKGAVLLLKKLVLGLKRCFVRKESAS